MPKRKKTSPATKATQAPSGDGNERGDSREDSRRIDESDERDGRTQERDDGSVERDGRGGDRSDDDRSHATSSADRNSEGGDERASEGEGHGRA